MKKYFFLIALFSVSVSSVYSQHIPPCRGVMHGSSSEGACWGYAVGRAFGRSWDDSRCPINSLTLNTVPTTYFDYAGFDIYDIQVGDIVGWGGGVMHVAYVISINSRTNDGIKLADRPNYGGDERSNLTLSYLITERGGNPDVYFTKKKLWSIVVRNDVEGNKYVGKVGIYGGGYSG
ncbi:MAG TPA: hypothetical protein ENN33_12830 [Ignavibacteria bacterium]|nr:hypothetical protein [Ignavibacteria bacterium]